MLPITVILFGTCHFPTRFTFRVTFRVRTVTSALLVSGASRGNVLVDPLLVVIKGGPDNREYQMILNTVRVA